ncbi:MAG: hypothetical protein KDA94_02530 [Acidimicrobiales bacterium]|nr:hypothetical protein [Acidimicrobiales bacterium]
MPSSAPLFGVSVWYDAAEDHVLGVPCARWASGEVPVWDDDGRDNVVAGCGDTRFDLWSRDRESGEWRSVEVDDDTPPDGYFVSDHRDGRALLLRKSARGATFVSVSTGEGSTTAVPEVPALDENAQYGLCFDSDDQPVALVVWQEGQPSAVMREGWRDDAVVASDRLGFVALRVDGDRWVSVPSMTDVAHDYGVPTCSERGIWDGSMFGGQFVAIGKSEASVIEVPAVPGAREAADFSARSLSGAGEPVAFLQGEFPKEGPDLPRDARAFVLDGTSWVEVDSVAVGTGSNPFLLGDAIGTVDATRGDLRLTLPG